MQTQKLTKATMIAVAFAASLSLQACNTVSGAGKDVSAGADAVTESADKNKRY
jgi:predicted small secreted protein